MSDNTLITDRVIAKEALMCLEDEAVLLNVVHRDLKREFVKKGATVSMRKPVKFTIRSGETYAAQAIQEDYVDVTISHQEGIDFSFSSQELTLSVDKISERYVRPAMRTIASKVDGDIAALAANLFHTVGVAADIPDTFATSAAIVGQRMDEMHMPADRSLIITPASYWALAATQSGLFMQDLAKTAYQRAKLGRIGNFEILADPNVNYHTNGTMVTGDTITVNGAGQVGSSIHMHTAATHHFHVGDVLTMAGAYAVDPISRATMSYLQEFVVTAVATGDGTHLDVSLYPSVITSGAYQTVSASPTTGGAVTVVASHWMNFGITKQTFGLCMIPMELPPPGSASGARETYNDMSVRFIKQYDIDSDKLKCRFDVLYGVKTLYPESGVRLLG